MLKNILDNATTKLEDNRLAQSRIRDNEQFLRSYAKVATAANNMDEVLKAAAEASDQGLMQVAIDAVFKNNLITALQGIIVQLKDNYFEDATVREITSHALTLKGQMDSTWKSAIAGISGQTISSLRLFGRFTPDEAEANACADKIQSYMQSIPLSSDGINDFISNLNLGRNIVQGVGADDEIKTFIEKATDERAFLVDITPKVQEWIRLHKLERKIKVRLA